MLMDNNQAIFNYEEDDSLFLPKGYTRAENKINKGRKTRKFNSSIWTLTQNQKYVQFLIQYKSTMQNAQERKQSRIFVKMSQFLKGRSPEQCRSHHQKIMKKYRSIQSIINNFLKFKEAKFNQKPNQKQQMLQKLTHQSEAQPILSKQQMPIQLVIVTSPETTMNQIEEIWGMLDQNVWTDNKNFPTNSLY